MENEELLNKLLDELSNLNRTQREINTTLKVLARKNVEESLTHIFKDDDEKLIYQLSDGDRTTADLANIISASKMKISRLWQKWDELRIVEKTGYRNPYRAKYSLEELALLFGNQTKITTSQPEEEEEEEEK